jgi:magnesium transporter
MRPTGYVTLGRLLSLARGVKLKEITEDSFRTIPATQDEGEVAYAFNQYHLISAPVVDEDGRLVGVITIDDAMNVLDEEHEEDILRLAGVGEESSLSDRVIDTTKRRFPWLAVNLITAILASLVIAQFEEAIAQIVALAVLMPIVASMGGNAGTQSLTVAVRALATKDLTARTSGG